MVAKRKEVASPGSPEGASFEEILGRLEEVVEQLEGGELPLERSLAIFEEGVKLSRLGASRLDQAERRVEELLGEDGSRTRRRTDLEDDPTGAEAPRSRSTKSA